ncbi:hypothetical protein AALT_g713 [Alternaria alternata]|nr:hypothetical protein AALT_g713 [Alternaria alternata]
MASQTESEEQVNTLYEECCKQLRTGLKLEELYQTEVKRLERRSEVCNGQKEKTTAVLNKYAQASCRKLCDRMLEVLPRELRDTIFEHFLPHSITLSKRLTAMDFNGQICQVCVESNGSVGFSTMIPVHLRETEYTPQGFYRELLERLFQTTTFDLGDDLSLIAALGSWDGGLGIGPADYPLNISFLIKFDWLDLWCKHDPWFVYDTPLWPKVFLTRLEGLFSFKPGTKLTICIQRHNVSLPITQEIKELECNAVVPIILPTLRRLAAIGTETRLCLGGGCELKVDNDKVTLEDMEDEWKKARSH